MSKQSKRDLKRAALLTSISGDRANRLAEQDRRDKENIQGAVLWRNASLPWPWNLPIAFGPNEKA